jgi:hypothetical protein
VVLLQGGFEASAQVQGQHSLGQEVVFAFWTDPAQTIGGETAGGQDTVDVGMETQVARPGLEHGQAADLGAQISVLPGDIGQSGGAFAQQQSVEAQALDAVMSLERSRTRRCGGGVPETAQDSADAATNHRGHAGRPIPRRGVQLTHDGLRGRC